MIASIKGYVEIMKELLQADVKIDQQAKVRDVCTARHHVPNSYTYTVHKHGSNSRVYEGRGEITPIVMNEAGIILKCVSQQLS